jgi:hypothetical protein
VPIDLVQAYVWFELAARGYQEASDAGTLAAFQQHLDRAVGQLEQL